VTAAEAAFTTGLHLGALIAAISSLALAGFVLARGRVGVLTGAPEPVDEDVTCAD
jgi:hypothetical protein